MKHVLLAAMDGTGSRKWRRPTDGLNSHVFRFYLDLVADHKLPVHGPDRLGGGMDANIHDTFQWILRQMGGLLRWGACSQDDIQVCLVGHSRGCVAAMKVANLLAAPWKVPGTPWQGRPVDVHFLGLYDAVDRWVGSADASLTNVRHCFHARRANISVFASRGSRGTFGSVKVDRATEKPFDSSHGGIGGDPGFFTRLDGVLEDYYCNALRTVLRPEELARDYGSVPKSGNRGVELGHEVSEYRPLEGEAKRARIGALRQFLKASRDADAFIRDGARAAGLIFAASSEHRPYLEADAHLWDRLQRLLTSGDALVAGPVA